jgi:transposase
MRDTELYRHLLGLVAPWEVSRVELSVADGRVDVWAQHPRRTRFACPQCERELAVYDHCEERAWRHLDSCGFLTYLRAYSRQAADDHTPQPDTPAGRV